MAKKTAKKPLTVKPRKTGADGVVLPGEKAAKTCTKAERDLLSDLLIKAAYRVDAHAVASPRLGAGTVASVGIHVGARGEMTIRASVVDAAGHEYEVNA